MPNITPLPVPPTRQDPANFNDRADTFLAALESPFVPELNALRTEVLGAQASANTSASTATTAANTAVGAADAAQAFANAAMWDADNFYDVGDLAISPTDFEPYRRIVAGTTANDPATDSTNWVKAADFYTKAEADAEFLTKNNPSYTGTLTGGTGVINIGSGQLYKDASGNVGIGTSSPAVKLQVQSGTLTNPTWTASDVVVAGNSTSNSTFYHALSDTAGGFVFSTPTVRARSFLLWNETNGNSTWQNGAVGAMVFHNNGAEAMRIDSAGKILAAAGTNWAGTVSQSGQSSVIESGSNANGKFTKFADGTQICSTNKPYNASPLTWPAAFDATTYLTIATNDDMNVVTTAVFSRTSTGISWVTNATANTINFVAIGRWY